MTAVVGRARRRNDEAYLEDAAGAADGVVEGHGVLASGADVEGDAHDVHAQRAGRLEEGEGAGRVRPELGAEAADGLGVVREDAEHHLRVRVNGLDLFVRWGLCVV